MMYLTIPQAVARSSGLRRFINRKIELYNGNVNKLHSFLDMVATQAKVVGLKNMFTINGKNLLEENGITKLDSCHDHTLSISKSTQAGNWFSHAMRNFPSNRCTCAYNNQLPRHAPYRYQPVCLTRKLSMMDQHT